MTLSTPRDETQDVGAIQSRLHRYERILEVSQQLASTLDHVTLLRQIVNAAAELTDSEAASILLVDPASDELRFEMASNMSSQALAGIAVPIEGSIAGWVVSHAEPRVIPDTSVEPDFFGDVDDETSFHTRNLIAVPLRGSRGKIIGALEALNKRGDTPHDANDVRTLIMLSMHAAIAIENARLFQQSDFMAEMVHELRTPLVALKTSAALLLRPDLPSNQHDDIVRTMSSETERLMRLTSEYLDLARLESGRAKLEVSDVPLGKLVHECVDIVLPQAAERGIQVKAVGTPLSVRADRGKIKQVLLNLLTNAVKYNREAGTIEVRINHLQLQQNLYGQIAVADTGFGIAKENLRNMFQKFYRVPDTSGYTQGTGLGLAIARHIIEAHGGEIWLESELGHGSTFYFTLPAAHHAMDKSG